MTPQITPIDIHGKDYIQVSDRVKLAHADEGYSMISQERYELNGRFFLSITIEVKGKRYIGDAEIKFGARANTPDGTNPLECSQTSALGRALGFANYGVLESIASADEVVRAEAAREPEPQEPAIPMTGVEAVESLIRSRLNQLYPEGKRLGLCATPKEFLRYIASVLEVEQCSASTLTISDLEIVASDLISRGHRAEEQRGDAA